MSSLDYLDLCRLCLVKDRVSVPIFEGEGDVRQIFLKITACLPVKVNREDKLPKKICDDCVYKIELCYQFWHTTANAEKQLLQWLGEVNMEDKQGYNVLNPNGMKPSEQSNENRLDGTVMQQVSEHQNNMNMGMMDNMGLSMPMMMSSNAQQQITSVPMDTSGSSVQNVQPVAGPSTQTTHDQITQNQTDAPTQQEEEDESSEEDENSDDECDGDEGLPIKEESEEDPNNSRTIEPTTFVNVSLACDEAGPSGLQQQKIPDMPEIVMPQTADVDPKTGIFVVGELIGQGIKIERSEEEFVEYNHTQIEIDSTVEDLVIKEEKPFNAAYSENFKNTSINSEKSKQKRSECARLIGRGIKIERSEEESEEYNHTQIEIDSTVEDLVIKEEKPFNASQTFVCDYCGNAFSRKSNLIAHMRAIHIKRRVHKTPKQHKCDRCDKSFVSELNLRDHTCPQMFLCVQCGKNFASSQSLKVHQRQHTGERPYQCELCPKAFPRAQSLKEHKRVHTGDRYKCDICEKTFAQPQSLKRHLRSIHLIASLNSILLLT